MALSVFEEKECLKKIEDFYVIKTFMPFPLRENNCFLAESDNGWCVIDTGVNIEQNKDIWKQALKQIGICFHHINTIILTHYHHDHMGLAGWMQDLSGAEVLLPHEDVITFHSYIAGSYYEEVRHDCLQAGWSEKLTRDLVADVAAIEPLVTPFPELSVLKDNHSFRFGDDFCTAAPLPGHTDGHVVLYNQKRETLFSGDNIVPHAILHLTDWPHTRLANPLNDHLKGLDRLTDLPVREIIPGHGKVFSSLKERVETIKKHHLRRKEAVYKGLDGRYTAWDLAIKLFRDNEYIHIKRLILAETLAYLEALHEEGLVDKEVVKKVSVYRKSFPLKS